jgi:hypothetical protein
MDTTTTQRDTQNPVTNVSAPKKPLAKQSDCTIPNELAVNDTVRIMPEERINIPVLQNNFAPDNDSFTVTDFNQNGQVDFPDFLLFTQASTHHLI